MSAAAAAVAQRASATTYQLQIEVARAIRVEVGRLGQFLFPRGSYVYTGSAKRNFAARIARHLRQEKTLRWHIDWLLASAGVRVIAVKRSRSTECAVNQRTGGTIVAPGFGASDCRSGCGSHLRYLGTRRASQ